MAYSKKRKYSKRRYKSRKTYKKPRVSKIVKRFVKREIHRQIENKIQDVQVIDAVIDNTITDGDVRNLIPLLSQGTNQQTRIGNRIRVMSLRMKLHVRCLNQTASISPVYFDIYIFKFKASNFGGGPPATADMLLFLQDGSSSTQYTGNNPLSGLRKVNDDYFTLCAKRRVALFQPTNATSQISSTSSLNPACTLTFDLTKHVKKLLIYDDAATGVQNDNLYIAIGATSMGGDDISSVNAGSYSYLIEMIYEDA